MASTSTPSVRSLSQNPRLHSRRKLAKKRYDDMPGMAKSSVQLPARFADYNEEEEEAEAEAQAIPQNSIYGLLTQARSQQALSADSESEDGEGRQSMDEAVAERTGKGKSKAEAKGHRKKFSETKFLRSLLKPIRERGDSVSQDMTQSQFLPGREDMDGLPRRSSSAEPSSHNEGTILERKLQAQAKAEMEEAESLQRDLTKPIKDSREVLAEIFKFDEPEDVIAQYPCFYVQTVLLHGDFYVTTKHVCFYAYVPRKDSVIKSGNISKKGKKDPRYARRWFVLKGDVLNYYKDAAHPYEPINGINLRYAINAELTPEKGKENDKETPFFTIVTENRTYYLRADSAASAKEWVKQLQKVIFRSHNDGDSVKMSIPIRNIVEVEEAPMMGSNDTVNLHVIDNGHDFAVDEYIFTFTSHGRSALQVLMDATDKSAAEDGDTIDRREDSGPSRSISVGKRRISRSPAAHVQENVRSTLSPLSPPGARPRLSGEYRRTSLDVSRASLDRGRASFDRGRSVSGNSRLGASESHSRRVSKSPLSPISTSAEDSVDSIATSSEHPPSPRSLGPGSVDMSASQMLSGDTAFRATTLRMPQPKRTVSGSTIDRLRRRSRESSRSPSIGDRVRIQLPSRTNTEQSLGEVYNSSSRPSSDRGLRKAQEEDKLQASDITIAPKQSRPAVTPLHHAATIAGYVRDQGKKVGSYLSSSPGVYYGKLSGAMAGGKRHYSEAEALNAEDRIMDPEDDVETAAAEKRFQEYFALPDSERLIAHFFGSLHRVLPLYGKIYLSTRYFCFRSLLPGTRTKIVIPLKEIDNAEKQKSYRIGYPGMVLVIKGHEELFFDFRSNGLRDDCTVSVLRLLQRVSDLEQSTILTEEEKANADAAATENEQLSAARKDTYAKHDLLPADMEEDGPPILFDDGAASMLSFKPKDPMRITCLTIGSRGDVQPYIALCKGLLEEGHKPRIATHREFQPWVEKHGIEFAPVEGNPAELMKLCVEYGMFTPKFISETNSKFRGWLDDLLSSAWKACQGSDLLIESPSAMAGIHIAEALGIPYYRAFGMPWTRTRAYPHAFAALSTKAGGSYNWSSYIIFENVFWAMTAGQINRWRNKELGLDNTNTTKMGQNKRPFLYNFSPSVVVPPLDFSDWVRVTGYWFLDEAVKYTPPPDLLAFITKAREDKMKLVYIGFGSVVVADSKDMTQKIIKAVLNADVRCILSKGWSDRLDGKDASVPEVPLPESIFQITSAPHDWLFKQIDAAVHHGGAGTTGASLRAGIPTLIKPFFGDQFFFATRIEDIGVGLKVKAISELGLGRALWIATHDDRMRNKASILGARIRAEDGVQTAIQAIYRDMEYANSLITPQKGKKGKEVDVDGAEDEEEYDEAWTFVDKENESAIDVVGEPEGLAIRGGSKKMSLGSIVLRGGGK